MNNAGFDPSGLTMDEGLGDPRRQSKLPGGYATQGNQLVLHMHKQICWLRRRLIQ